MSNRPGQLAHIQPGKSIGAQPNLAATLNWLISCIDSMTGEGDVEVSGKDSGNLVISVQPHDDNAGGGGGGGGGKVYEFVSALDSNVKITTTEQGDGSTRVEIGVYYT